MLSSSLLQGYNYDIYTGTYCTALIVFTKLTISAVEALDFRILSTMSLNNNTYIYETILSPSPLCISYHSSTGISILSSNIYWINSFKYTSINVIYWSNLN